MISKLRLRNHFVAWVAVAVLGLSLLVCLPSNGQIVGATIDGTVADSSGATVANATISIKNTNTGVIRETTSNTAGFYTAPNLMPGNYEVTASAPGFKKQIRSDVTLTVGAQQVLNVTMDVGAVDQQVEVTTEAPAVQLSSSSLSAELDATTVRELPLNGRDWTMLATLQPGVVSMGALQPGIGGGSGSARGNRGFGTQLTISGGRPSQNNYRVDGISVNDYGNSSPGNALGVALGVDAIQEFSVVTSNYSAEYGRTSGGVINAITRSGSNQFHGSVYEFLRNSALDARNYFDGATKPGFRRNQFGASGGAPIRKDKTFVFVDYEGLRQSLGITNRANTPSVNARDGILNFASTADFPSGCVATANPNQCQVSVDPVMARALALWRPPNLGLNGLGNTGVYSFIAQQVATENFVTGRIDHHFSDKDSVFGTYQWERSLATTPDSLNNVLTGQRTGHQSIALEETHVFSAQMINAARFGYNRVSDQGGYGVSAINPAAADLTLGAIPGQDIAQTFVTSLTTLQAGLVNQNNTLFHWNSFQFYDDVVITKGRHSIKIGGDIERDQNNVLQHSTVGGQYRFNSLSDFLTNRPASLAATIPSTVSPRYFRQSIFGGYVQDDIRWRPNLTINLGLRYEMSTNATEKDNKLVGLPSPTAAAAHIGGPIFSNPTYRNFEPRVGFAWDPFRDGKTSIRAGFGMFDVLPLLYEYSLTELNLAPYTLSGRVTGLPQGSFATGGFALLGAANLQRVAYIEPNPKRNYVMQWNLSVQREITSGLTATVAYLGSRGIHQLFRGDDMNMVLPTLTPAGYLWPCGPDGKGNACAAGFLPTGTQSAPAPSIVLNPNFGRIDVSTWNTNSFYHALETKLSKRLSHGFQIQGSYTWSKSIDGGSGSGLGDPFANSISNMFFFDTKFNRSLSDFNVGQNLVINYTWTLPTPAFSMRAANWALGGWELGGVFTARTGLPFTALMGGDPLGTKDSAPVAYPNRLTGPGCETGVTGDPKGYIKLSCFAAPNPLTLLGNSRRNSLTGPGLTNFDFSLFKNNPVRSISETFNAQFRVEFFNVLNHANFNPPTDNETVIGATGGAVGGAGVINTLSTTARDIQFALKLLW